jgi:hypothetical protein
MIALAARAEDCTACRRRSAFVGYEDQDKRRVADENIRAFVGERLSNMPAIEVDSLSPQERTRYDRVLLRCEFLNQTAFKVFEREPTPERIAAIERADAELKAAAQELEQADVAAFDEILARVEEAFDKRDAAMMQA